MVILLSCSGSLASHALCFYAAKLMVPLSAHLYVSAPDDRRHERGALSLSAGGGDRPGRSLWRQRQAWGKRTSLSRPVSFSSISFQRWGSLISFLCVIHSWRTTLQYVASMGPIALFAGVLAKKFSPRWRELSPMLRMTILILCFGNLWMSIFREARKRRIWTSLWQDTLVKNPSAALAHNDVAGLAIARGDWASVPMHLQAALALQARAGAGALQ